MSDKAGKGATWSQRKKERDARVEAARQARIKSGVRRPFKELFAWVAAYGDTEGIMAMVARQNSMPLITTDKKHLPALRDMAQTIVDGSGIAGRLVRMEVAEEWPALSADPESPERGKGHVIPLLDAGEEAAAEAMIGRPIPDEDPEPVRGIIRVATEGGRVGIHFSKMDRALFMSPAAARDLAESMLATAGGIEGVTYMVVKAGSPETMKATRREANGDVE